MLVIDHAPYDPAAVYVTGNLWCISTQQETTIFGGDLDPPAPVQLRVHYWDTDAGRSVHHLEHHGLIFATVDEARAHAYEHGLLFRWERKP